MKRKRTTTTREQAPETKPPAAVRLEHGEYWELVARMQEADAKAQQLQVAYQAAMDARAQKDALLGTLAAKYGFSAEAPSYRFNHATMELTPEG